MFKESGFGQPSEGGESRGDEIIDVPVHTEDGIGFRELGPEEAEALRREIEEARKKNGNGK